MRHALRFIVRVPLELWMRSAALAFLGAYCFAMWLWDDSPDERS